MAISAATVEVAVIVDLVDSKAILDRSAAQREILDAFSVVDSHLPHRQPLRATVGDEFQAVYASTAVALQATLLARLMLPDEIDCRFGLGRGTVVDVGDGVGGVIQDGSGWWLAREAINEAHRREDSRTPSLRGWFRADPDHLTLESLVNAYLLSRDHIVSAMTARGRRVTVGIMLGRSQNDLAEAEGITQSAVSQTLRRSGGSSLIAALAEIERVAA